MAPGRPSLKRGVSSRTLASSVNSHFTLLPSCLYPWRGFLSLQAGLSLQNHPHPGWWTQAREGRRGAGPSLHELGKAVCASHSYSHCDGCTFYWMVSADTMCLRLTKAFLCFNRKKTRSGKCHRVFSFIRWRKEITYTKVSLGECVRQRTCHFVQPA